MLLSGSSTANITSTTATTNTVSHHTDGNSTIVHLYNCYGNTELQQLLPKLLLADHYIEKKNLFHHKTTLEINYFNIYALYLLYLSSGSFR